MVYNNQINLNRTLRDYNRIAFLINSHSQPPWYIPIMNEESGTIPILLLRKHQFRHSKNNSAEQHNGQCFIPHHDNHLFSRQYTFFTAKCIGLIMEQILELSLAPHKVSWWSEPFIPIITAPHVYCIILFFKTSI